MLWAEFIFSAVIIIFAGSRLTLYADILSDRYNIHKAWIGVALLGMITSIPEAITSIAAVSVGAIDLAVGNILGSNNINPMIIVVMDAMYRKGSITDSVDSNRAHTISALFAIILSMIVLGQIYLSPRIPGPCTGYIVLGDFLIAGLYFYGIKVLASQGEEPSVLEPQVSGGSKDVSLFRIYGNLVLCAVLVIAAAIWLANVGDRLAETTGLGETFFGSTFLAFVTSLPEMVVSISAVRLGSFGLAIGNIFGSNMVNIFILVLCDVFFRQGSILVFASQTHIITIVLSAILVSLPVIGINLKNKKKILWLGWDSVMMTIIFLLGSWIIYYLR